MSNVKTNISYARSINKAIFSIQPFLIQQIYALYLLWKFSTAFQSNAIKVDLEEKKNSALVASFARKFLIIATMDNNHHHHNKCAEQIFYVLIKLRANRIDTNKEITKKKCDKKRLQVK